MNQKLLAEAVDLAGGGLRSTGAHTEPASMKKVPRREGDGHYTRASHLFEEQGT